MSNFVKITKESLANIKVGDFIIPKAAPKHKQKILDIIYRDATSINIKIEDIILKTKNPLHIHINLRDERHFFFEYALKNKIDKILEL